MEEGVNVIIPEQVRDKLEKLAEKNGVSMGAMILALVEKYENDKVVKENVYEKRGMLIL